MSFMNERGSVSLYALIVLVPLVLFLGLLFDFARYRAADRMTEQQAKAAARSVLSAYDRELFEQYGLFGLDASEEDMLAYAEMPFTRPGQGFAAVSPRLAGLHVEPVYSLADHRFFRRQVLEEMKLKGPVEFARRVYDNWKNESDVLAEAADTVKWSEEAEQELRKREEALREAFRTVERMGSLISQGHVILSRPRPVPPAPEETDESDRSGEEQAAEEASEEQSEDGSKEDDSDSVQSENPYEEAWPVFDSLQVELDALKRHLHSAEQSEDRIRAYMDDGPGDLLAGVSLYGSSFYSQYVLDAGIPVSMFGASAAAANEDPYYAEIDLSFDGTYRSFYARVSREEEARRSAFGDLENRKEEKRQQTRNELDKAKNRIAELACSPGDEEPYSRLGDIYRSYLLFNTAGGDSGLDTNPADALEQDPEHLQKQIFAMLRNLSGLLETIRDEALVNEYVLLYFNHRVTGLDGEPPVEDVLHHVLAGEAEYVLYGLGSCTANRMAAYAEMYSVRFAVRTIEALVDVRKAATGSPLLILLTAAAEGAAKAYGDMERLLDGEAIPVFRKSPSLRMGYADYLRLFLALHSNETKKMARMQALIELNTGIRLTERPVYVRVVSSSEFAFRMLPAVGRLIADDAYEGGQGTVAIVKQAEMAF